MGKIIQTRIDLSKWRGSQENKVLSGRDTGAAVREKAGISVLDSAPGPIEVVVPADLFSLTSSYFLGLFGDSIKKMGEAKFRTHYTFTGKRIDRVINDAIQTALITSSI